MSDRYQKFSPVLDRLRPGRERRPRQPSQVMALDVDGTILRVVQAARDGVSKILAAPLELAADADRNDPVVLGAAIAKALAKLRIKPVSVVMGVPRARVVLRTLTVPVMDKMPELASMVHFQVGKDLPFRIEDAVIDFKVRREIAGQTLKVEKSGASDATAETAPAVPRLEVLVAVLKRDVVDFYQRLAEASGFRLDALGLLPYANARCVEECHVADGDAPFALVSLRPDEIGIDVIAQQALVFSRGAAVRQGTDTPATGDSSTPASEDAFIRNAVIEVVRSLHGYGGQDGSPAIGKLVVTGATGHEAEVMAAIEGRLSTPCALLDPSSALKLAPELREHAAGSIGALGLALGRSDAKGLPFDFLNPKKPAIQRDLRKIRIWTAVGTGILALFAVLALRSVLINRHTATLNAAMAELADAEKKRPVYLRMIQQDRVVDEWLRGDRDWLEHYAYLTSILPPSEEIYLTSLAVSGQGSVRLSVQARSGETLARLEKQLHAAGYEVRPIAITPGADRFGYEFRSTVELLVPDNLKIDLHKVKAASRPIDDVSLDATAYKRGGG